MSLVLPAASGGLSWIDWSLILAYLGGILALGAWAARKQASNAEYFTSARFHLGPSLIGISHFAALLSTITYLAMPGEVIQKGPIVALGFIVSIPIAYWIVSRWILPRIMQQRVTSAYELLENRLGWTGRMMGAILFVKLRLVWMGLLVHVSSTAMTVILGLDQKWTPLVALVVGIVPLVYASMGGLRAVVFANVIQFFLLVAGALVSVVVITLRMDGFSWWPAVWSSNWDSQPMFSLDPHVRSTMATAVLSMVIWRVCTAGGDQMAIQHYMATRDLKAARRSFLFTSLAGVVVIAMLVVLGLALLGFFARFPELAGEGMSVGNRADLLFPYFISHLLPVGIAGLVVAAIVAASSGMDTGVNAVTAVVIRDFFEPLGWGSNDDRSRLRFTRFLSFGIGLVVVGASLLVSKVPGNFLEMTNKLANLETTTIFGLFFLALFVPYATALGAVMGALYGLTAAVLVAFWDVITGRVAISFLYIGAVGLACNLVVGCLVSRFGPRTGNRRQTLLAAAVLVTILALSVGGLVVSAKLGDAIASR